MKGEKKKTWEILYIPRYFWLLPPLYLIKIANSIITRQFLSNTSLLVFFPENFWIFPWPQKPFLFPGFSWQGFPGIRIPFPGHSFTWPTFSITSSYMWTSGLSCAPWTQHHRSLLPGLVCTLTKKHLSDYPKENPSMAHFSPFLHPGPRWFCVLCPSCLEPDAAEDRGPTS